MLTIRDSHKEKVAHMTGPPESSPARLAGKGLWPLVGRSKARNPIMQSGMRAGAIMRDVIPSRLP